MTMLDIAAAIFVTVVGGLLLTVIVRRSDDHAQQERHNQENTRIRKALQSPTTVADYYGSRFTASFNNPTSTTVYIQHVGAGPYDSTLERLEAWVEFLFDETSSTSSHENARSLSIVS